MIPPEWWCASCEVGFIDWRSACWCCGGEAIRASTKSAVNYRTRSVGWNRRPV